jgi:hypothetical protein
VVAARGNPLALLELPARLTDRQLRGGGEGRRPDDARARAGALGLPDSTLQSAQEAGLVQLTARWRSAPLVRSPVYRLATRSERRAAHETIAEVMDDPMRPRGGARRRPHQGGDDGCCVPARPRGALLLRVLSLDT